MDYSKALMQTKNIIRKHFISRQELLAEIDKLTNDDDYYDEDNEFLVGKFTRKLRELFK